MLITSQTPIPGQILTRKIFSIQIIKLVIFVELEYNAQRWDMWLVAEMKLWSEGVCHVDSDIFQAQG